MNTNKYLLNADAEICNCISRYPAQSRGEICVGILAQLRTFIQHLMVALVPPDKLPDDDYKKICKAINYIRKMPGMGDLIELHDLLEKSCSHYTYSPDISERLVLKYYPYLFRIKKRILESYGVNLLNNLQDFPLNLDKNDEQYYENIARSFENSKNISESRIDRFYVQKIKPFVAFGKMYYELTLVPALDNVSKFDHLIAFTDRFINTEYAVDIEYVHADVPIFDSNVPTTFVKTWKIQIRGCEFANFAKLILGVDPKITPNEQLQINAYLMRHRQTLCNIVTYTNGQYVEFKKEIESSGKIYRFLDVLDKCRNLVMKKLPGGNVIRYLLLSMNNKTIKSQQNWAWDENCHGKRLIQNANLSLLFVHAKCRPFDSMPYYFSLHNHNPRILDLLHSIPAEGHEDELLARFVRNNTESKCTLRTSIEDCESNGFSNVDSLIDSFNSKITWESGKSQKLLRDGNKLYIYAYLYETAFILKRLEELSILPVTNYSDFVSLRLGELSAQIDDCEKLNILNKLFVNTHVGMIYGPAGTGKTFLMDLISKIFAGNEKVYVAQTNPAVNNLRRRMPSDTNSHFFTIESYKKQKFDKKHILFMDESSTVSNYDMKQVLEKDSYMALILVGDTYQIASIRFGNWFSLAERYLKADCIHRLNTPYRAKGTHLIEFWKRVRTMEPGIEEYIAHNDYSFRLDESVLKPLSDDEIVLCLNYDGLYGINNINRYMQANNKGKAEEWGGKIYKIGDPVLFNDNDRFAGKLFNNLKGTIIGIETYASYEGTTHIVFTLEVDTSLTEFDGSEDLKVLPSAKKGKSVIRFEVDERKNYDDEESNNSRSVVPFDVAYAVSIHKAQGLEYESVKVIITNEIEEEISHNIFYTAITRSTKNLRIYWSSETEHKILTSIQPIKADKDLGFVKYFINGQISN